MKYIKVKYSVWNDFEIQTIVFGYHIEERFFTLHDDGLLEVRAGYSWDGASGAFDTDDFIKASCVHDIFCELINAGRMPEYVQALADEQMRIIEKKAGMPAWRRIYTYMIVRLYQITKKAGVRRKIYEVP